MQTGKFITFEGIEGAGKTTQIPLVAKALTTLGKQVLITREPGGNPGAEEIRNLLVQGKVNKWDGMTEALLLAAARRVHVEQTIKPALKQGQWVLCDRFTDSTIAYQSFAYGVPLTQIQQLMQLAIEDFQPDLTILLSLDVQQGLSRAKSRGEQNRYEAMEIEFHQRVSHGFQQLATQYSQRIHAINVENLNITEVTEHIMQLIQTQLL